VPVAGGAVSLNDKGDTATWQEVRADSLHQFSIHGAGNGSYLYLTYFSPSEKNALLHVKGNSALFFNGTPHAGDVYANGWLYIPVKLRKGINELYIRPSGSVTARLVFTTTPVQLNTVDLTLPGIEIAKRNSDLQGAVVIINNTAKVLRGMELQSDLEGVSAHSIVPDIPVMSCRKVPFDINATGITAKGQYPCTLTLLDKKRRIDQKKITLTAIASGERYNVTFISRIDGSLQYYAVTPQTPEPLSGEALFLSVHGAGVEASGQAGAYEPKTWGTVVAATNRRAYGFDWEDWGRLDALEVLALAKDRFHPDPRRIYLTGHSMGGHGTWFLGAAYPGNWAAIGACSGYPVLREYAASHDTGMSDSNRSPIEQLLLRSGNQSNVLRLATNYKPLGVYVLHGDADPVVPVKYARQMRKLLGGFHTDMSYYEYPGGEHWFGNQSVDWKPLFDFFKWHQIPADSTVNTIDFLTANPGVTSSYHWAAIQQQIHPLLYSHLWLNRNRLEHSITGSSENIRMLRIDLTDFGSKAGITIRLDSLNTLHYTTISASDTLYLIKDSVSWSFTSGPYPGQKGPGRYGTFKEAFDHHMLFVYSTAGNKEENEWSYNKARYDAENWYYRGNGAVDIITDKEYVSGRYRDRGVILYGNASTNAAWNLLLKDCPLQVRRGELKAGEKSWKGDDLAAYFVWPNHDNNVSSVAVITGTGIQGMQAANANQYFAGGSGFPDYMIFSQQMLQSGATGIKLAGFFGNDWQLTPDEAVENPTK
jgi:dienelactone hydrolase